MSQVGRALFETQKKRYTILDAPGHKNYVPNMIGGAALADVGVLVISARKVGLIRELSGAVLQNCGAALPLDTQRLLVVLQ